MGRPVIYAHGLEGNPNGTKARWFRDAGLKLHAPDGQNKVLADRIIDLEAEMNAHPDAVVVGSSYGGLASLFLVHNGAPAAGLLLLAPALHWSEAPATAPDKLKVPESMPCILIHGSGDDVVPMATSEALVKRCPHIELRVVDDDHRLKESRDAILQALADLGAPAGPTHAHRDL